MELTKKVIAIVRFFLKKNDTAFAEFPVFEGEPFILPSVGDTVDMEGGLLTDEYTECPMNYDFDYYVVKSIHYSYEGSQTPKVINIGNCTKQIGVLNSVLIDITVKGGYYENN